MSNEEKTKLVKVKLENGITFWVEATELDAPSKSSKESKESKELGKSKDSKK